jgi:hypothetical protein
MVGLFQYSFPFRTMQIRAFSLKPNSPIVGLQIVPPACQQDKPFHLALLLDTSASMTGSRIASVQRTLHALIDIMTNADALTLLEYNSVAQVHCCACSDKTELRRITDALYCKNSTNLEEALHAFAGLRVPPENPIQTVCILTDGQNTEGLQGTQELQFLVERRIPAGIPVCTLGYGEDHNETLLQALALNTRGSYNVIVAEEGVPMTVGNIVGAMKSEVAKNARVRLNGRCLEPLADTNVADYWIGPLFAEKPQWVVLEGEGPIEVWWTTDREETYTVEVEPCVGDENREVLVQLFRVQALVAMQKAKKALESGYGCAMLLEELRNLKNTMERSSVSDTALVVRLMSQMHQLMGTLEHPPPMGFPHPMMASRLGRQFSCPGTVGNIHGLLTRLTSDMTTMTVQRGVLSQDPGMNEDPDMFTSPVQRGVSGALVHGFSQNPT